MIKNLVNLKGNTLTQKLTEHFGYLLPNTHWKPVLLAIMEQVLSAEIIEDTLILHFSGKKTLTATPGVKAGTYQDWPQSFQDIVTHHEYLTFPDEGWGFTLGQSQNFEPNISVGEALEYYENDIPLLAPFTNYSDWMVYHPDEKTTTGGSVLCDFDHGTCDFGKRITHDVGAVFLMVLAQDLALDLNFPSAPKIKTEDNTAHQKWWKALSPAWKFFLRDEFELKELSEEEIPPVNSIKCQNRLRIWGHKNIVDPTPLLKFTGLKELSISNSGITDFTFLTQLKKLKELDLDTRDIEDLSPLKDLTKLQNLSLVETKVIDLAPLKNLKQLKILHLRGTKITDLSPLKNLTKLQTLAIVETNISNLSPLQNCCQLKSLYLNETAITNIDALSNCIQLVELALSGTKVQNLSMLSQLENICEIDISRTKVTSLTSLHTLKNLKNLNILGTNIDLKEILSFLTAVPNCYLLCDYYRDAKLSKSALLKLESIVDIEQEYAAFTFKILDSLFKKDDISNDEIYRLLTNFVQFLPITIKSDLQQKLLILSLDILMSVRAENKEINTEEVEIRMLEYLLPDEVDNDDLTYSLALYFAQQNNRENTIRFTKKALNLGVEQHRFLTDDFALFQADAGFRAVFDFPDPTVDPQVWWDALSEDWQKCFMHNINTDTITIKKDVNKILALTQFNGLRLEVKNLHTLGYLTKLKKLRLCGGRYISLNPLSKLSDLEEIELKDNREIRNLTPFESLTKLKSIRIHADYGVHQIESLYPLRNLKNLESLFITGSFIDDLDPLQNCTKLRDIGLVRSKVKDPAPIAKLPELETVYLGDSSLETVAPFTKTPKLQELYIANTNVPEEKIAALKKARPEIEIIWI